MSQEPTSPTSTLFRTPTEALGPAIREHVLLENQEFVILRPGESERLLDHPFVHSAHADDEYMPYWADLWPASRMLAKAILREKWTPGTEALELGCGLGLPGIAALAAGLRVTFSDYDATALEYAGNSARLNDFEDFEILQMDWRAPPGNRHFPVILASDLVYELRNVEPLVDSILRLLAPDGLCLMTDQDRIPARRLKERLAEAGLRFRTEPIRAGEPGGRRVKGTLYRITHGPS
jgi:predicted nicotinamide N-methyase